MTAALPTDPKARKDAPMYRGLLKYFPRALAYVAYVSLVGNEQHNPGQPIHWDREKSTDHGDCVTRHQCDAGGFDTDNVRHSGKVAWRALAQLEIELEEAEKDDNGALVEPAPAPKPSPNAQQIIDNLKKNVIVSPSRYYCSHGIYAFYSNGDGSVTCSGCGKIFRGAQ